MKPMCVIGALFRPVAVGRLEVRWIIDMAKLQVGVHFDFSFRFTVLLNQIAKHLRRNESFVAA